MVQATSPWYEAYPAPKNAAPIIPRQELLQWIHDGKQAGVDFALIDLRRTDLEGGTIRGAINLPAQSLYPTIPALYSLLSSSKVKHVIWYCGSCGGRGTRAAAWFADYLEERQDSSLESLALEGGIKGWAAGGKEFTDLMDKYDESVWANLKSQ